MKAGIYCRISLDQTGESLGVTRQLEDCTALVESAGWTLVEVYTDNDISASSGKPRPEYQRMLRDIEAGQLDAIVAWHPDRLYRKLKDLEALIETVERRKALIRTCRAGDFDLGTPTGRMMARILASVSAGEGEIKADRWRRSVLQRREAGAVPYSRSRLFGYDSSGGVVEEEAELVRWMAEEMLTGRSLNGMVKELHERGILTTAGNAWSMASVRKMLTNPRLAGFAKLDRTEKHTTPEGRTITRRVSDIVGRGNWEPILTEETWEGLRAVLTARQDSRPLPQRVSLLTGIIYCGRCGNRMVTGSRTTKKKGGPLARTYRCTRVPGQGGCMKVAAQALPVEEIVESYTQKVLADPRVVARLSDLRKSPGPRQHELAQVELRITELEHQLDQPGVPVATILRAIDRAKEKQERILRELAAQPSTPIPKRGTEWPTDLLRRRALVDLVVAKVTVNPSTTPGRFDPARVEISPR